MGLLPRVTAPLFAKPYAWDDGDLTKNTRILDFMVDHPGWFQVSTEPEARRAEFAATLFDPTSLTWEVWRGGEFVGILNLMQMQHPVDAILHFVFLDHNLVGRRRFLHQFLTYCFEQLGFHRLTILIPEEVGVMVRFARRLGFRFEGENAIKEHPALALLGMNHPDTWVARVGSRREQAQHLNGIYRDVLQLRLLAAEHAALAVGR